MEEAILAKKALALMILVKPRVGEPLEEYVRRAEAEVRRMHAGQRESASQGG